MPRSTYETIRSAVLKEYLGFFEQRPDAMGQLGASTYQKITVSFRMLCYGAAADQLVEVLGMSESLVMECLPRYCDAIVKTLGGIYLREPTAEELAKTEARFAVLDFPGCVGSVDCASWVWDVCPVGWSGKFQRTREEEVRSTGRNL
jgi:Plant transposon protein